MSETNATTSQAMQIAGSSNVASSAEMHPEMDEKCRKRLEDLLKQTEMFAHFMHKEPTTVLSKDTVNAKKGKGGRFTKKAKASTSTAVNGNQAEANTTEVVGFTESPDFIKNGEMRDYQIRGLNWMISLYENGINGILADEMGLGKTLQTISLLGYLQHYRNNTGPHLIIVPKTTLQNWINEINKWCPSLKAICFWAEKDKRSKLISETFLPGKWNICVTSYETCLQEKTNLKKFAWQYVIIDEAQRIKNDQTRLATIVRTLKTSHRLLLTGTPLQNNLHELWALLNFLLPHLFANSDDFDAWFNTNECLNNMALVERLRSVLKPFMLRRVKADVEKSLLPKQEIKVYVQLTELQREWYKKLLLQNVTFIDGTGVVRKKRLENILMQLRKVCNHPYLFDGAEAGPPYTTDRHLMDNSGKMAVLDKLLVRLQQQGSRVLLFCTMTTMLNIIEDYCHWRGYKYCRLDGNSRHEDRMRMIDEFNAPNSELFMFLLSTRAGGLGINLATADSVIFYDSDWNPQVDIQAADRAHRIGQKKQVRVFRFVTENTVDEKIIERAEIKFRLDKMVIQRGGDKSTDKPNTETLISMLRHGAAQIFSEEQAEATDEDIDVILERCAARTEEYNKKLDAMGENKEFTLDSQGSAYDFEGINWKEKQKEFKMAAEKAEFQRRKAKPLVFEPEQMQEEEQEEQERVQEPVQEKKVHYRPDKPRDFQFYPKRLVELVKKETLYWKKTHYYVGATDKAKAEIANAEFLTDDEEAEKDRLMAEAFISWDHDDFNAYVDAVEKYGNGRDEVYFSVSGKSPRQVREYEAAFQSRWTELRDYAKIKERFERAEADARKIARALAETVKNSTNPLRGINPLVPQHVKVSQFFGNFILVAANQIGLNHPHLGQELKSMIVERQSEFPKQTKSMRPSTLVDKVLLMSKLIYEQSTRYGSFGGLTISPPKRKMEENVGGPNPKVLKMEVPAKAFNLKNENKENVDASPLKRKADTNIQDIEHDAKKPKFGGDLNNSFSYL